MILTFASSKGGVGKSTTCAALASALALEGARVSLLDLDQNRTLDRWAKKAPIEGSASRPSRPMNSVTSFAGTRPPASTTISASTCRARAR